MGFLDNKKDTQYFQPYPWRSGGSHGHFYKKTICRQTKDLQSAALTRNTMCGCFVRIPHWLKVFWCCLLLFLTGFVALTSLFYETKTHLRRGRFLLKETNGRTAICYLFFFTVNMGKKKSGKTERHKRVQSLKPLRATTWNDTKLWRKSANAWCFRSWFWMFLLPTSPSWKCPQIFTEILPVWKKDTLGCLGNGMCGWVRRWTERRERWGPRTVVLPKVLFGLINIQYVVYLSGETRMSITLGMTGGKRMWKSNKHLTHDVNSQLCVECGHTSLRNWGLTRSFIAF